jgi:hypothetical protein
MLEDALGRASGRPARVVAVLMLAALVTATAFAAAAPSRKEDPAPVPAPAARPAPPASPAPAEAGKPAQPAPPAPAAPVAAAPPAPPPPPGLDKAKAKGSAKLVLELSKPLRLGGFDFRLSFDGLAFALDDPAPEAGLASYLCQANTTVPGNLRYSCVGIPKVEVGGALATLTVHFRDRPATPADFRVDLADVVDEFAQPQPGVKLSLAPPKAP